MGVLACDRVDCENIMCNRFSETHGYICNTCFDELVQWGVETDIAVFMRALPQCGRIKGAHTLFDTAFPIRNA